LTAPAVEDQSGKHPWGDADPETPLTPENLADRLGIPTDDDKAREALRQRLRTWRKANLDGGWLEDQDAKHKQPKFYYRVGKVWDRIKDLRPSG